ncbi:copper-binding protein [Massilia niastensis]|uniref:copper-binding protein n=1 Tax=Massilia niastensis TaxID=544911 RepID=UPI00037B0D64|nr:copper-binding protein [Massilia niastensis]
MNAFSKLTIALALTASASIAFAQEGSHSGHGSHGAHSSHAGHLAAAATELVDGEVKKVDRDAGKITLRHGELKNLNMGAMTMVFRVKDPAMLNQVKTGDKIKFAADRVNGALAIVELQAVQ